MVELDENVNDRISNNEVKVRNHPGLVRTTNLDLPVNLKNAILGVLGGMQFTHILARELNEYLRLLNVPERFPTQKQLYFCNNHLNEKSERIPVKN